MFIYPYNFHITDKDLLISRVHPFKNDYVFISTNYG